MPRLAGMARAGRQRDYEGLKDDAMPLAGDDRVRVHEGYERSSWEPVIRGKNPLPFFNQPRNIHTWNLPARERVGQDLIS